MAEAYPNGEFLLHPNPTRSNSRPDPPIKRFAQRHTYHSTDAIAARDLGVAIVRQSSGTTSSSSSNNSLGRTDTQTSFMTSAGTPQSTPAPSAPPAQHKRPPSPDHKRKDSDSHGPAPYKRARGASPPGRDRWEGHGGSRKRYNSPTWDRDRDRDVPPPRKVRDHEEEKPVNVPSVISWFIGTLPGPSAFDGQSVLVHHLPRNIYWRLNNDFAGPVFRTDDLMQVFRGAVIPSATGRSRSPPPPAPRASEHRFFFPSSLCVVCGLIMQLGGGRPPPDYGPYQGPGGGRRRY